MSVSAARWSAGCGVLVALALLAQGAAAQPVDTERRQRARDLGEEGLRYYDAEAWEAAVERLADADAVVAAPTFRLYAARALVRLGRLVEADARYGEAAAMELPPDASPVLLEARAVAREERHALAPRIPTLSLVFYAGRPLAVAIDGAETAAAGPQRIDPGRHRIELTSPGGRRTRRDVVVGLGERRTETFDFSSTGGGSAPDRGGVQRAIGLIALGVGGVSLATWGVTGALAMAEADELGCEGERCNAADDELGTLRALRTTSAVTFYAGAGIAATGLVLVFTAPSEETAVTIGLSPSGIEAAGRF